MRKKKNDRGFSYIEFDDYYKQKCSLQMSSLATNAAIWLGVDNTGPLMDSKPVNHRMHLTKREVKKLLPHLIKFIESESI